MPTPGERKALGFFAAVLVLGSLTRAAAKLRSDEPADEASKRALAAQIAAVDSAREERKRSKGKKRSRKAKQQEPPPPPPGPIDLDIASVEEIETLRWIGPSLAKRIVADRDSLGPFGSIERLERVRGIGPALAKRIEPQVTFSLVPRPSSTENERSPPASRRRKPRRGDTDS